MMIVSKIHGNFCSRCGWRHGRAGEHHDPQVEPKCFRCGVTLSVMV